MGNSDCIFCKIVDGQMKATLVAQGDDFIAIRDINPQAPSHILVIPKGHVGNIAEHEDAEALGKLFQKAVAVARDESLDKGFRLVVNTGTQSGQTVDHLHIHILGGRTMKWPPG